MEAVARELRKVEPDLVVTQAGGFQGDYSYWMRLGSHVAWPRLIRKYNVFPRVIGHLETVRDRRVSVGHLP